MSCNHVLRQRVAIFQKDKVFGLIALAISPTHNIVSRNDPRLAQPVIYKSFETPAEADHWFAEYVIATGTENAWSVVFNGQPNNEWLS